MTSEEKACIECNELWPNDAEFFQHGRNGTDLLCVCRACYLERYRTTTRRSKKALTAATPISPATALQSFFSSLVTASRQQQTKGT